MIQYKCKWNRNGFTLVELLVIIVVVILLASLILPNLASVRNRARRINCLENMNRCWKSISAWGLSPEDSNRPGSAETNGIEALRRLPPEVFICPEAGRLCKTKPDTNCYYQYYYGRRDSDGDKVILCDMNGPNQIAGPNAWGGNHGGKGGNIVKVAGSGQWVDSINCPGKCSITNPEIAKAFATNGIMVLFQRK